MISCFPHSPGPPDRAALALALGPAAPGWARMSSLLEGAAGSPGTWQSYGPRYGWRLDFRLKAGPLAGLYPRQGEFLCVINLLKRDWPAAFELPLGPAVKQLLEASAPLADGRTLLIPILDEGALQDAWQLIRLKRQGHGPLGRID